MWLCEGKRYKKFNLHPLNYNWMSSESTKWFISVLHWLHRGIWHSTTWWDNHTTNTVEDRWKRPERDQKHELGTSSSNASWWGIQLLKKKKTTFCQTRMSTFLRPFISLPWHFYTKPRRTSRSSSRRAQRKQLEIRWWHRVNSRK